MVDRVKPQEWVLPNRVGFPEWTYKTFNTDRYATKRTSMFIQQRLVRDFLQKPSPYRGLFFYHGLGSGKTCSAIAATEAYSFSGRKVVIMLPASLAQNYLNELMSCGNLARWSAVTLDTDVAADAAILAVLKKTFHYGADLLRTTIIDQEGLKRAKAKKHAKAPTKMQVWFPWMPRMPDTDVTAEARGKAKAGFIPLFDSARCDVYNIRYKRLEEEQREKVDKTLKHILPHLYHFIKYNGLSQKLLDTYTPTFFDNSIIVIDEAHNFISQSTHIGTLNYRLYQHIRAARNSRIILLSGTPAINHPIEIAAALNLLRGDLRVLELTKPSDAPFPTSAEVAAALQGRKLNGASLDRYIDDVVLLPGEHKIRIVLLPHGFVRKEGAAQAQVNNIEVQNKSWGMSPDAFEKRLTELFAPTAKAKALHYDAYPKTAETFNELFLDVSDPLKPKMQEQDLFMRRALGLVSYLTNVNEGDDENTATYPTVLPERVIEVPMSAHQFEAYEKNRKKELEMEQSQAKRKGSGRVDPFAKVSSVYRAFSRMTCNFAFPKELNRPFPRDMRAAAKQMDVAEDDEAEEEAAQPKAKASENAYEKAMQQTMDKLKERSAEYLTVDALTESYSPKMAKALEDIVESPGKVLFYSQFRTIEGVGVFRQVLLQAGWAEIVVNNSRQSGQGQAANNTWKVTGQAGPNGSALTLAELFAPAYDQKRFVIFNSDRQKTEVLMRIFNGQLDLLPPYLRRTLEPFMGTVKPANLRGEKCKMMMVTQSGAEGISLKHVRRVIILEPFWNKVRIDQVIGRAARRFSHTDLPLIERNVEVRIYTSVFTPEQIAKSFTIATHERGISSDTHIAMTAANKDRILGEFLTSLKRASVDCTILAKTNQTSASDACYSFPRRQPRSDLAFVADIAEDRQKAAALARRTVAIQVSGRVVNAKGIGKVVMLPDDPRMYDYEAYKHGRVLMPAQS